MNTKIKHTPGEWRIDNNGSILGPSNGTSSPIICIMSAWFRDHRNQGHVSQDKQEANARLIAAAPDLLEACKAMLEGVANWYPSAMPLKIQIQEAVKKAEGKEA